MVFVFFLLRRVTFLLFGAGWYFRWRLSLSLFLSESVGLAVASSSRRVESRVPALMGRRPREQLGLSAAVASPSTLHLVSEHLAGRGHVDPLHPFSSLSLPFPPLLAVSLLYLLFFFFSATSSSSIYPMSLTALSSSSSHSSSSPSPASTSILKQSS